MNAELIKLVQLARAGQRQEALRNLRIYLQEHPHDIQAWVFLGGIAPEPKIAVAALRQALTLDPENAGAQQGLAALESRLRSKTHTYHPTISSQSDISASQSPAGRPTFPLERSASPRETPSVVASKLQQEESATEASTNEPAAEPVSAVTVDPEEQQATSEARQEGSALPATAPHATQNDFQALQQARSIIWPFRPRGEKKRTLAALLAEGKVTRQDLTWASEHAREAELRWAAGIVLKSVSRLPNISMTEQEARLIAWPFRRLNRPLGELVNEGAVKATDLRRATWFAEDARLRQAARLLLPTAAQRQGLQAQEKVQDKQQAARRFASNPLPARGEELRGDDPSPSPSAQLDLGTSRPLRKGGRGGTEVYRETLGSQARPMSIVQGSEYLLQEIRQRQRWEIILTLAGVAFLGTAVLILGWAALSRLGGGTPSPIWAGLLILVLIVPLFWMGAHLTELVREQQTFEQGHMAEVQISKLLRQGLDGTWVLFRNVKMPSSKMDIGMVLIGPPGLFTLEVKAYSGRYTYRKAHWYHHNILGMRRMHQNPGKQAQAGATLLHTYIEQTLNRDVLVEPRLVWAGPGQLKLQQPQVFVWFKDNLADEMQRLQTVSPRLSPEDLAAISGLLRGLCSTL